MGQRSRRGTATTQTYGIVRLNEGVIDGDNVDVVVLNGIAEDDTTDTTEAVDADLDWCHDGKSG